MGGSLHIKKKEDSRARALLKHSWLLSTTLLNEYLLLRYADGRGTMIYHKAMPIVEAKRPHAERRWNQHQSNLTRGYICSLP